MLQQLPGPRAVASAGAEIGMNSSLSDTFADHIEPEVLQFETNAALWGLEVDRHAFRLRENQAIGEDDASDNEAASTALEGVMFEIDRLQAFARAHLGMADAAVLRLAEAGLSLELARRRLNRAMGPGIENS
ncbi:hypothetical protein EON80_23785 [bacterium]|nr:MAG: hypothetical protein EON80_23785 [bacterium]